MTYRSTISRSLLFTAAACLALQATASADETVKLKPKFPEGRQRYVEVSQEIEQVVRGGPAPGGGMKISFKTIDGVIEEVVSSSKKRVKLKLTFDRKAMSLKHPTMGPHAYDSDRSDDDSSSHLEEILAPMIGVSLRLRMDRSDCTSTVKGMKPAFKKITAGVSKLNAFFPSMKDELDDANAAADWGATRFWLLPNKTVGVGDTWTRTREESVPSRGGRTYEVQCKLDRLEQLDGRAVAIITYTGTVTPDSEKPAEPGSSGLVVSLMEGTFQGTATFDVKRREIVRRVVAAKMKIKAAFKAGGPNMPGMDIEVTTKTTTTVKSIEAREAEKKANGQTSKEEADEKKTAR